MRDYTKPDKCHASIHAALGDPKGLLWHLQQGSSVEVKEGKTALHMLSENIKLMKKPTKDSIASKYVVWAIDVLIDALLKNKADPNLPTDVSKLSAQLIRDT
ncbi:12052_t:CDS:2 [Entrophospora sp. SA101]|nr:12052_t:CDS:2 [Entrophospora sp. SA101]CAJ0844019.1 13293_t:CDS:2 [Entrophospora sp. SA101]CAJ0906260.1 12430_t:CDS:2 [Entrophospora sp. SA101]